MSLNRIQVPLLALASLITLAGQLGQAQGLSPAEFDRLHAELQAPREPWQSIPWRLSLLDARDQAAKEKKPIYLLCRSGHPLGCV